MFLATATVEEEVMRTRHFIPSCIEEDDDDAAATVDGVVFFLQRAPHEKI